MTEYRQKEKVHGMLHLTFVVHHSFIHSFSQLKMYWAFLSMAISSEFFKFILSTISLSAAHCFCFVHAVYIPWEYFNRLYFFQNSFRHTEKLRWYRDPPTGLIFVYLLQSTNTDTLLSTKWHSLFRCHQFLPNILVLFQEQDTTLLRLFVALPMYQTLFCFMTKRGLKSTS